MSESTGSSRSWTFLSNHAHVLVCVAEQPDVRIRDIAFRVGITERAASNIVSDLEVDGYLTRERLGRNNHYRLNRSLPLRHPLEQHKKIGDLLSLLTFGILHPKKNSRILNQWNEARFWLRPLRTTSRSNPTLSPPCPIATW
jgi:DNA-binding MarR family transcriptional regulator